MKGNNKALFSSLFVVLLVLLTNNNVFAKWRPTGSIQVFDNVLNRNVPVVGVEVRLRNWFRSWQGYTDNNGNFSSSERFIGDISCFLRWQYKDNMFDIRPGAIGQAYYNGPNNKKSAWNLVITSGMSWVYAHIFRAGSYYIKQEPFGPSNNPFSRISICAYNRNAPSTESGHYNNVNENIIMYKNNSSGNSYTARQLFSIASHELAHAHHDEIYTGGSVYANTNSRLRESWAVAVSYFLTSSVYSLPLNSPNYYWYTKQNFESSSTSDYTPLMIDLIDDFNQRTLNSTFLDDPVKGYTLQQMETILRKAGCKTVQDFKNEIKALPLPAGVSAIDRDTYLNQSVEEQIDEIIAGSWRVSLSTGRLKSAGIWTTAGYHNGRNLIGDFDGDGRDDLIQHIGTGWRVLVSRGSSLLSGGIWTTAGYHNANLIGDFDGDGRDDLIQFIGTGWRVLLSTGQSLQSAGIWTTAGYHNGRNLIGDFDGDGRDDLIQYGLIP